MGNLVSRFIDPIDRAQKNQTTALHVLAQCEFILTRIILGEEKYFVGQGVDIGKDGQILGLFPKSVCQGAGRPFFRLFALRTKATSSESS